MHRCYMKITNSLLSVFFGGYLTLKGIKFLIPTDKEQFMKLYADQRSIFEDSSVRVSLLFYFMLDLSCFLEFV